MFRRVVRRLCGKCPVSGSSPYYVRSGRVTTLNKGNFILYDRYFIIYPSVLRRVQGSLETIEVPLQAGQSPPSKKAWEAFEELTLSVGGIKQVKDTGVDHGIEGCANSTVSLFIYFWFGEYLKEYSVQ